MNVGHFYHNEVSNHTRIGDDYPFCSNLGNHCFFYNHLGSRPFYNHLVNFDFILVQTDTHILIDRLPENSSSAIFYHLCGHHVALFALLGHDLI